MVSSWSVVKFSSYLSVGMLFSNTGIGSKGPKFWVVCVVLAFVSVVVFTNGGKACVFA